MSFVSIDKINSLPHVRVARRLDFGNSAYGHSEYTELTVSQGKNFMPGVPTKKSISERVDYIIILQKQLTRS